MKATNKLMPLMLTTILTTAVIPATTHADQVILDDLIVDRVCIGNDCVSGEAFGNELKIKDQFNPSIKFETTCANCDDWRFITFPFSFGIQSSSTVAEILTINANARQNSVYISDTGVGLGTSAPAGDLDIDAGTNGQAEIRLQSNVTIPIPDSIPFRIDRTWEVYGGTNAFQVRDVTGGNATPFNISAGAPSNSLHVQSSGRIGLGTAGPGAALHVKRADGTNNILVEETNATTAARGLFTLRNNGGSFVTFDNTATAKSWFFVHENNVGGRFMINHSDHSGPTFAVSPNGDMEVDGSITTNGSCSVGCDRVFAADYELPSIEEHAKAMWAKKHLPAVGPTPEKGKYNITDKMGRMLNELEKAHIYIEQLHNEARGAKNEVTDLRKRLVAQEAGKGKLVDETAAIASLVVEMRKEIDQLKAILR